MGDQEEVVQLATISDRLNFHKKRGKFLAAKAEEILRSKVKTAAFLKWDDAAMYFYKSSISYRICGKWREGAEVLKRCAEMHEQLKLYLEAATLYTEVAEIFMKVDKGEAVATTRKAISIYCDAGRFDIAGRMERKIADMHFMNKHWEEAAFHYKKCANFLSGEQLLDQSDACLEAAAVAMMELKELDEARNLWELIASGCVQSNLRRFQARDALFMGVLCMVGIPWRYPYHELDGTEENTVEAIVDRVGQAKYSEIEAMIIEYEKIDYLWRCAKEIAFFKNIIKYRLAFEIHDLVDHMYFWNNVRPLTRFQLQFLKVMIEEVSTELSRRAELRRLELMRKELAVERRKKREETAAKFEELGIIGGLTVEMLEEWYDADEKRVMDTATQATLVWGLKGAKKHVKKMRISADGDLIPVSEKIASSEQGSAKVVEGLQAAGEDGEENENKEDSGKKKGGNLAFADDDDEDEEDEEEAQDNATVGTAGKERKKRVKT